MNNPTYILAIFEGEVTEKKIFDNLKQYFFDENNLIVYGFHCGEIYSLYHKLSKDEDLDLFVLLKEHLQNKNTELQNISKEQVSEMFLFFDYDGHATGADFDKLKDMIELFDNETENGKLYISYPMVEAIKHLSFDIEFKDTVATSSKTYKREVAQKGSNEFKDLSNLSLDKWKYIIDENCKKANFIVNGIFKIPQDEISQSKILSNQKDKYIDKINKVAVLSGFSLFLVDYYGYEYLTIRKRSK